MHKFMERELGWKTVQANISGNSVIYDMQSPVTKQILRLELRSDDSCEVTLEGESRIIPSRVVIGKELRLKKDADKLMQGRILSQVIDELLRRHRTVTHADVEDMMGRYSRGHL